MNDLQRDFGRVEAKVENLTEDVKIIKADLAEIKKLLSNRIAVKENDWKRLSAVALLASLVTSAFNWIKPFIT